MRRASVIFLLLALFALAATCWLTLDKTNIGESGSVTTTPTDGGAPRTEIAPSSRPAAESMPASRPDATPPPGAIVGRVVDRGGIGLPAARLTATLVAPPGRRNFALVESFDAVSTSDDEGRFRFDVPGGGVYRIMAEADGFGPGFVDGLVPGQDTEILLLPPATLEGVCRDLDGGLPVEGAEVVVTPVDGTPVRRMTTGKDGAFRFANLAGGKAVAVADHPTYAPAIPLDIELESGDRREISFELDPGKQLVGTVVSEEERLPIEGAVVSIGKKKTKTAKDGKFVLKGVSASRHSVQVSAVGFLPDARQVTLSGTRREGAVSVVLRRGATIRGRVIAENGDPIEGAELRVFDTWGDQTSWWENWDTRHLKTKSAADGAFTMSGLPADEHSQRGLRSRHPEWPDRFQPIPKLKNAGDVETVTIVMRAGSKIEGIVVDPEGRGIVGARVELVTANNWGGDAEETDEETGATKPARKRVVASKDEGAFLFTGLAPGRYRVIVNVKGYPAGWNDNVTVDQQGRSQPVRIQLRPGTPLSGIVLADVDQSPIPNARIFVSCPSGHADGTSAKDGTFTLESIGKAPYWVRVEALGYAELTMDNQTPGPDGLALRMKRLARVTGKVVDKKSGKPVTDFTVKATGDDPRRPGQRRNVLWLGCSAKDGTFAATLAPGKVSIVVEAAGFAEAPEQSLTIEAGVDPEPLEFALTKGGAIEGTVRNANGDPLSDVTLWVGKDDEEHFRTSTSTESDGYYFLPDLKPGIYRVSAQWWMLPTETARSIVVDAERPTRVDIQFSQPSAVTLAVSMDPERSEAAAGAGAPEVGETTANNAQETPEKVLARYRASAWPNARIEALEQQTVEFETRWISGNWETVPSTHQSVWLERGRNGYSAKLGHLQPGRYRLTVRAPLHETRTEIINVGYGSTHTYRIEMKARSGARLDPTRRGRVLYPDGSSESINDRRSRWGNWGNEGG